MNSLNLKTIFQKGLSFLFCSFLMLSNLSAHGECNLDAPKNFEAYNISSTWLQLRWERVSNASGYWVETEDANSGIILSSQRITADSCKIEGLEPLNTYNFRIYTMCSEDEKSYLYNLLSSITTIIIETKPGGQYPQSSLYSYTILNQSNTSTYISCNENNGYFCRAYGLVGPPLAFSLKVKSASPFIPSLNLVDGYFGPLKLCLPTPSCWGEGPYVVLSDNNIDILKIFPLENGCGLSIQFVNPVSEYNSNYKISIGSTLAVYSAQDKSAELSLGEPDTHYFQLDDRRPDLFKYFIYNIMGELILEFESADQEFNFLNNDQFKGLAAGLYLINRRGKNLNQTNKVLKLQ
jgi:hypothetical protein